MVAALVMVAVSMVPALAQDATDEPAQPPSEPDADVQVDVDPATGTGTDPDLPSDPTDMPSDQPARPGVAVSVQDDVVLDLTISDSVTVDVVIVLTNPTEQVVEDVVVIVTGAELVSEVPSRLEPGQVIELQATMVITSGEAPAGGFITVEAVMTGVIGGGEDVTAEAIDFAPLIEISATVIEREDPAPTVDDDAPMVLDEVLEASTPEDAETAAQVDELPATGVMTADLVALAASAWWAGAGLRAAGRRREESATG